MMIDLLEMYEQIKRILERFCHTGPRNKQKLKLTKRTLG